MSERVAELGNLAQQHAAADDLLAAETILIGDLRRRGQPAVDALIAYRSRLIPQKHPAVSKRFENIIDRVAGQRFATNSALFWHTSLADAQQQAAKWGRPILSLVT